jgi:hypothetical protein
MLPHVAAVIARAAEGLGAAINGAADARLGSAVTSAGTCTRRLVGWCSHVHLRSSSWNDGLENTTRSCCRVRRLSRKKVELRRQRHQEGVTHGGSNGIIEGPVAKCTSIFGVCVKIAVGVVYIQRPKEFLSKSLVHRRGAKLLRVRMARAQVCWRYQYGRWLRVFALRRKGITAWC